MISERISDDIPPLMKILNMVIPILMRFYSLVSNWNVVSRIKPYKGVRHSTKCDVINDAKLFPTVYPRIYCRKFLTLSNQTSRYKTKSIRINYISPLCLAPHIRGIDVSQQFHTGQCKRTGGCYNEQVVAFFSTGGGVKGKKIYTC